MLFSVILLGYRAISPTARQTPWPRWSVPVLLTIALAVAAYLSFVEVSQVAAVCGPVGDCNAVQQSSRQPPRPSTYCRKCRGGNTNKTFRAELVCIVDDLDSGMLVAQTPSFSLVLLPLRKYRN
jgi:hypothetical protein